MTQKMVQAAFLSPTPLWSSRWETHTSQLLHFPNYFSPTLTLTSCFQKGKREDLESKTRRNGFYSPSSPPTGGYCLLPSLGFLRKVGGDKGKGASRYSRKIEKKEMVLRKSYFLIYMIRWQMNWARLKIRFLETFNINFILEKKKTWHHESSLSLKHFLGIWEQSRGWLGPCASSPEGVGSIPGQELRSHKPHSVGKKVKQNMF